jgi:dGTPase
MMVWGRLMSPERFRGSDERPSRDREGGERSLRSPFIRDFDRIVYSSAFRRLQDTTQVYPFPESDYVRTRLTHSIEASSVGRSLGLSVGQRLLQDGLDDVDASGHPPGPSDFGDIVAAACLAHDIGHPPFGHAGEEAIRHWFAIDRPDLLEEGCTEAEQADLTHFESNAQGLRILTRLQFWRDHGGMQLCSGTLGAVTKYPWGCLGVKAMSGEPIVRRKFGFFQQDKASFQLIAEQLGLERRLEESDGWCRHPLAYLVEAADDICYLIVDIEDGFQSGRMLFNETEEILMRVARQEGSGYRELRQPVDRITFLRTKAIGALIEQTVDVFCANAPKLLSGDGLRPLLEIIEDHRVVQEVRQLCQERLYNDERKVKAEIAGFAALRGLLQFYTEAILALERVGYDMERLPYLYRRAILTLPAGEAVPRRRYEWLLWITDHVSGMTDRFAVAQYKTIRGISVG